MSVVVDHIIRVDLALILINVFQHKLLVVPESCDLLFSSLEPLLGFFEFLLFVLLF